MGREINQRKAAIIGCGFVGSATAFTLMQSQLFSELVLVDVDFDKADGEAKDIAHGIPFAGQMKIHAGVYEDLSDAAIIIVTAGAVRSRERQDWIWCIRMWRFMKVLFRELQNRIRMRYY